MPARRLEPPPHGVARYRGRWRCRCDVCREANSEAVREWRREKFGLPGRRRPEVEHGTRSCYVKGCREPECVRANREYQREYARRMRGQW